MISNFIKFFTKEGQKVFDPFSGIGSTQVACTRTNRIGYGMELNSKYFNIIKKRAPNFKNNIHNVDCRKSIEIFEQDSFDFSISMLIVSNLMFFLYVVIGKMGTKLLKDNFSYLSFFLLVLFSVFLFTEAINLI
jgi:tRNA G37 N-methylase Trm5